MQIPEYEIVHLKSGIKSLRQIANHETFHPGIGPMAEAKILHVAQHRFKERITKDERFIIWDVGLGAAANVVAALDELKDLGGAIEIHSFDRTLSALEFALESIDDLDYLKAYESEARILLREGRAQIGEHITWHLHCGDFRDTLEDPGLPLPHSIFYDPYSPRGNVDMWNLDHFTAMVRRLGTTRPFLMTNYTRSTYVRVTWLLAGFHVGVGSAIGEKEETSIASNVLGELQNPLAAPWLKRVRVSHSSAPLRGPEYRVGPIAPEDFERLAGHPQFRSGQD